MRFGSDCIGETYADAESMRMPDPSRCLAYGYVEDMSVLLFFRPDPKKGRLGSADRHGPPSGAGTPYAVWSPADGTLYVVFRGQIVTPLSGAKDGALLIFPPWYTSGNSAYGNKSDHTGPGIR